LSSKNVCKTNRIAQLKFAGQEKSTPGEIAETFNATTQTLAKNLPLKFHPPNMNQVSILNQLINLSHSKLRRLMLFTNR
jgi:hypothetical protein